MVEGSGGPAGAHKGRPYPGPGAASPPPSNVAEALAHARAALSSTPAGLFTDVDGTISEIAEAPDRATVLPAARRALRRLVRRVDTVAAVSGRAARDARRMVRVADLTYIGNHGLEVLRGRSWQVHPAAAPYLEPLQQCLAELRRWLDTEGIRVEDKSASAAVHYRLARDRVRARELIVEALQRSSACRALRATDGRMVVNLLPPVDVNKGTAIRTIAKQRGLRGLVYIGDDVTDLDAFQALAELRTEGLTTAAIAVASSEAPGALAERSNAMLPNVQAVVTLLEALGAEGLGNRETGHQ